MIQPNKISSRGDDGELTLAVFNGSNKLTVTWKKGDDIIAQQADGLSALLPGTYSVTVHDIDKNCTKTLSHTFIPYKVPPNVICKSVVVSSTPEYNTSSNGSVTLQSFESSCEIPGKNEIVWTDAFGLEIGSGVSKYDLPKGSYFAIVTDPCKNKCVKETYVDRVTEPCNGRVLKLIPVDPTCGNSQDGSVTAILEGAVGTPKYLWNNGSTESQIPSLVNGVYSVTVKDDVCPGVSDFRILKGPENMRAISWATDPFDDCASSKGTLNVRLSKGTSPYNISWSPGDISEETWEANPGTYVLNVSDFNNCQAIPETLTINAPQKECVCLTPFKIEVTSTGTSCKGARDGSAVVSVIGNTTNATIALDWGNADPDHLLVGKHSVIATIPGTQCFVTGTADITESPDVCPDRCLLENSYVPTDITCPGISTGKIVVTASKAKGKVTIDWIHIPDAQEPDGDLFTLSQLSQGDYKYILTDNGINNCSITQTVSIAQPGIPDVSYSSKELCPDKPVVLTSSVETGNVWSTGETTRSIKVNSIGDYTLLYPGADVCASLKSTITITNGLDCPCTTCNGLCNPVVAPEVEYKDSCRSQQYQNAVINATHKYDAYLEEQKRIFQQEYVIQCLKAQETFTMDFGGTADREFHHTLYYYDQGGNLVRTIPPAGVVPIADQTTLDKVKIDRENGTQSTFTNHQMATTYTYNSLNQLVGQKVPDHATLNIEDLNTQVIDKNISNLVATSLQYTGNGNGFLTASIPNEKEGLIYFTKDGGDSWSPLSNIGINNLNDVQIADANTVCLLHNSNRETK